MEPELTVQDKKRIKESIQGKYTKVSDSPEGLFRYPTGQAGLEALHYDPDILRDLPEVAVTSYCGVGNPFSLGSIHEGESVLDIGCGGGVDTLVAAIMAGPTGKAVGIDMIPEMLERAKKNLQATSLKNVTFRECSAEDLPFTDDSFDVVISNGVFNLIPDKAKALAEAFRVMKPHGRFMIADNVLSGQLLEDTKTKVDRWAR
jgi:arsenite methyltransferase